MAKKLFIFLDPAHGADVKGKRSPDETHLEYLWSRDVCNRMYKALIARGFDTKITNLSNKEIGLSARKNYVNNYVVEPGQIKFLISLHNNAMGDGTMWGKARGFEVYTTPGKTLSDSAADVVMGCLNRNFNGSIPMRADLSDGDLDKEANFTVLTGNYMAILVEWLFMDNKEDLALLKDEATTTKFIDSLVEAIELIEGDPNYSSFYGNVS